MKKSIRVEAFGMLHQVSFDSAGWAGVCPVFNTKEEADKYADGKAAVLEIIVQ